MRKNSILFPALMGLVGVAILLGLGSWQVQRLGWKRDLIASAEARLEQPPIALSIEADPAATIGLPAAATGRFAHDQESYVLTTRKPRGPGFLVVAPFELASGGRILVDRGYVPEVLRDPATRAAGQVEGLVTVSGVLAQPNETDSFTPAPALATRDWFARDAEKMATEMQTAPLLLVASEPAPGGFPAGTKPGVHLPNDHLEYAITWFSLAAIWAAMGVYWIIRIRRGEG